ncbi:hypothetical protein RI065_09715 [Mycoplasmatota bacterium zrk1]
MVSLYRYNDYVNGLGQPDYIVRDKENGLTLHVYEYIKPHNIDVSPVYLIKKRSKSSYVFVMSSTLFTNVFYEGIKKENDLDRGIINLFGVFKKHKFYSLVLKTFFIILAFIAFYLSQIDILSYLRVMGTIIIITVVGMITLKFFLIEYLKASFRKKSRL